MLWTLQSWNATKGVWKTVRKHIEDSEVQPIRDANVADGMVEGVDFRFVQEDPVPAPAVGKAKVDKPDKPEKPKGAK